MEKHEEELRAVWSLLRETLNPALNKLYAGQVDCIDQMAFWNSVRDVEKFVDVIDYGDGAGMPEYENINNRIEELGKILSPASSSPA